MVELRFLGPVEISGGRSPDTILSRPRDLALLAYVAVANASSSACTRDLVATVFWPESSSERSRNALNQALHRIRRATSDDIFDARGSQGLQLNSRRISSDVARFLELVEAGDREGALALYRGAFLEGLHIRRPGLFESWLDGERERIRRVAQRATRELRDSAERAGKDAAALRWARRALEISDREEQDVRRLIELLARSGDRVAALRVFQDLERWMAEEMDTTPSDETQALVASLRVEVTRAGNGRPTDRAAAPTNGTARGGLEGVSPDPPPTVRSASEADSDAPGIEETVSRAFRRSALRLGAAAAVILVAAGPLGPGAEGNGEPDLSAAALVFLQRGEEYASAGGASVLGDREANWRLALEMFERAEQLSPGSAAVQAALGMAHLRLFHWGFDRSTERQVLARRAIDRSVQLNPRDPRATKALGWYHLWAERDYQRALEAGQRTLELAPEDVDALTMAFGSLRRLGRAHEAIPILERAMALQGEGVFLRWEAASTRMGLRDYDAALDELNESLALFPTHTGLHFEKWLTTLLISGDVTAGWRVVDTMRGRLAAEQLWPIEFGLHWLGREYDQALAVLDLERPETFHIQQGDLPAELLTGLVHRLAGRRALAEEMYRRSIASLRDMVQARPEEPWFHGWLAIALAGAGDRDGALTEAQIAEHLAELEPDAWENPYLVQEVVVHAYIMAADYDRAVGLVTDLLQSTHYRAISREWIRMDPRFDPLRTDSRFRQVVGS